MVPQSLQGGRRKVAKLRVGEEFFERYCVTALKEVFDQNQMPADCEVEATLEEDFIPFSGDEIRQLCEQAGLPKNGKHLDRQQPPRNSRAAAGNATDRIGSVVGRVWRAVFGS
jgi:hypothetical protein